MYTLKCMYSAACFHKLSNLGLFDVNHRYKHFEALKVKTTRRAVVLRQLSFSVEIVSQLCTCSS